MISFYIMHYCHLFFLENNIIQRKQQLSKLFIITCAAMGAASKQRLQHQIAAQQ